MRIPFLRNYQQQNELLTDLSQLQAYIQKNLHAKYRSPWDRMKITLYKPIDRNTLSSNMFTVEFPTNLDSHVFILFQKEVIEVDSSLREILINRLGRFTPKQTVFIEGDEYSLGDFVVRLGSLTIANQKRALAIDIEYKPSLHCYQCEKPMICEFLGMIIDTTPTAAITSSVAPRSGNTTTSAGLPADPLSAIQKPKIPSMDTTDVDFSKLKDLPHDQYSMRHLVVQYITLLDKVVRFGST
jgi:hypothetical protein